MSGAPHLEHDWYPRPLPGYVALGARSWLYSAFAFAHAAPRTDDEGSSLAVRIGNDTGIYNGTFFELGPRAEVEIGDFCTLVGAIIRTEGRVSIGHYSFLAHEVVLADTPHAAPPGVGENSATPDAPKAPRETDAASITLGENCWVGMGAILLGGTRLGEGCVVGAGAVVDFAAPAWSIIAGNPARIVSTAR